MSLARFGSLRARGGAESDGDALLRVLSRQVPVDSLSALIGSLRANDAEIPLSETALALDANVFLRLGSHRRGADIVDYLTVRHASALHNSRSSDPRILE